MPRPFVRRSQSISRFDFDYPNNGVETVNIPFNIFDTTTEYDDVYDICGSQNGDVYFTMWEHDIVLKYNIDSNSFTKLTHENIRRSKILCVNDVVYFFGGNSIDNVYYAHVLVNNTFSAIPSIGYPVVSNDGRHIYGFDVGHAGYTGIFTDGDALTNYEPESELSVSIRKFDMVNNTVSTITLDSEHAYKISDAILTGNGKIVCSGTSSMQNKYFVFDTTTDTMAGPYACGVGMAFPNSPKSLCLGIDGNVYFIGGMGVCRINKTDWSASMVGTAGVATDNYLPMVLPNGNLLFKYSSNPNMSLYKLEQIPSNRTMCFDIRVLVGPYMR